MRQGRVRIVSLCLFLFAGTVVTRCWGGVSETRERLWREGHEAVGRGDFGVAMERWEGAARLCEEPAERARRVKVLLALGSVYEMAGRRRQAWELAGVLQGIARAPEEKAALKDLATTLALLEGDEDTARRAAMEGLTLLGHSAVEDLNDPGEVNLLHERIQTGRPSSNKSGQEREASRLAASLWNNLGNVELIGKKNRRALFCYARAEALARGGGDGAVLARVLINACRVSAALGEKALVERTAATVESELASWKNSHGRAQMYLGLAGAAGSVMGQTNALRWMKGGYQAALAAGDGRGQSEALGMMGRLYALDGQFAEARKLFERAAFQAQQISASELHYRWLWGLARCRREAGEREMALTHYRRAAESLRGVRYDLVRGLGNGPGPESFGESVGDLYSEMVDLLLQEAAEQSNHELAIPLLKEARRTQELLRSAELEDYFRDECVSLALAQSKPVDEIAERTAVLYVIVLPDRAELLVSLAGDQMERFKVPIRGPELEKTLLEFRGLLEKRTTYEYLRLARQLHDWLIAPLLGLLEQNDVDTLVIIPGGALRLAPLAALHDGERYLVEKFALAAAPGLTLLGPKALESPRRQRVLAAGSSVSTPGYAELENVEEELRHLCGLADGKLILDDGFTLAGLAKAFRDDSFSVVHFASHGQFDESAHGTFLVLHEGRLSLDQLEQLIKPSQYRGQPVELLGLSACETASGSARAGLGLAGVALKAGARSALATLWSVNDEASRLLVDRFYDQVLRTHSPGKAKALQQAQCTLIADPRYRHPAYWSPYLIIGNWL